MSNYYTGFSCLLPVGSADNVRLALAIYEAFSAEKASADDVLGFEAKEHCSDGEGGEASEVWMYSQDGNPEDVLDYVFRCAEALSLSGIWGFCWSMSCSRARLDGFGGGAQVVDLATRKTIDWIDLGEWLAKQGNEYLLGRPLTRARPSHSRTSPSRPASPRRPNGPSRPCRRSFQKTCEAASLCRFPTLMMTRAVP